MPPAVAAPPRPAMAMKFRLPDLGGNCVGTIPPLRSGSLPWQGLTSPRVCSPAFRRHVPIVPPEGGATNRSFRRRGNALIHSATKQGDSRQRKRQPAGENNSQNSPCPFRCRAPKKCQSHFRKIHQNPIEVRKSEIIVFMRVNSDVCFLHGVSCWLHVFMYADRPGLPGSLRCTPAGTPPFYTEAAEPIQLQP